MSDREGQRLGNYRLLHLIGRGSFADVYLGEHLHLNTLAAIKVLNTHFTSEEKERFYSEARTIARLAHPHIVRIFDFDVEDGIPFLTMEYAPNGTLRQRHPKGTKVPLEIVVSYAKQVAEALHYIHKQKLIHRDVKPESMLLGRNNEVLLAEFGIAIIAQSTGSQQTQQIQEAADSVAYMAPEYLGGKPRPASDQYALAVVVYEWLSGDPPFTGSIQQITSQHLSTPPPPLDTKIPTISSAVEHVVLQALDKDIQQRFANVEDFAMALEEAFDAESTGRTLFVPASKYAAASGYSKSAMRNFPTGTVTLLFTDIEGSTHLLQQLGDRYASLLAECRHLQRASFQEWNGHEVDTRGDAFLVAFARATDAVLAAVEVQRALAAHPWSEGVVVRARMGLHTGEPTLTSEGYVGLDVHRAARIMSAAHGGQVLLSQTTCNLVEQDLPDDVTLHDLGEQRLKDLGRPKRLFQLVILGLPADFPPPKTLDSYPNNLPVQLTPFIGREQEVIAVCDLLRREDVHLLALTGPGGTGKTRLALQVAAELSDLFADGAFFVNLAPISDPALVVPTIAETLGIRERADRSLLERLKENLRQEQMLLLLDNFEQVVSAAVQVVDLLVACPPLKVMMTSREVPHVRARHEFAVPPLPLPDLKHLPDLAALSHYAAVALFISQAQAVKPDFQMTATNAHAIAEVCARLDGLPLAIELAAAHIKLLPPQALLARLGQRFTLLTSGARDVPERQQTLRKTIAWSYNLLEAQEQRLFQRLSAFAGGCTLEAIEAVCAAFGDEAGTVLDGVASLIDKSLLHQTEQEGEQPRLVMLETIREYGLECLNASTEMEVTRQAHAAYYLALAEKAELEFDSPQQAVWLERLEQEHDNLRAALQWLLEQREVGPSKEVALRLGAALRRFWDVRGYYSEGRSFLEKALAGSEEVAASVRAKALRAAANLALSQEDHDRVETLCEESLALCREFGDKQGAAYSLYLLGHLAWNRSNYAAARSLIEESLAFWREVGERDGIAWSLTTLADVASEQGEYTRGRALYEQSLALQRELGNKRGVAWSLFGLALVLFVSQSDPTTIHLLLEESLTLFRELGHKEGIATSFSLSGQLALSQGNTAAAISLAEKSLVLNREIGRPEGIAKSLWLLARAAAVHGDQATARALYEQSLAIAIEGKSKHDIDLFLEGLAGVVAAQGEPAWAARLYGAAEAFRDANSIPIVPVYRAEYERSDAATRAQLGEQAFAAAWAEGRAMTPEQALAAQGPVAMPTAAPAGPSSVPPVPKAPTYPDELTAREVEVLRLLAQGMTNEQIAKQLVISPRTVNTHLTSIFSKIGVSTRSAATRYAIDHHLV